MFGGVSFLLPIFLDCIRNKWGIQADPLESSLMSSNCNAGESMGEFSPVNRRSSPSSVLHIGGIVPEVHGVEGGLVASHANSAAKRLIDRTIIACFSHERVNGFDLSPTCSKKKKKKGNEAGTVSEVWGQTQPYSRALVLGFKLNRSTWLIGRRCRCMECNKSLPLDANIQLLALYIGFWFIE